MRRLAFSTGLIFATLLVPTVTDAQTTRAQKARACAQLEGELASLQRLADSRSSRNFAKFDAAVHKQQAQLDTANRRAKRDNCFGRRGLLFRRTPKETCPALLKRIDKMKGNLAALEKKRSRYAPARPGNTAQQKAAILRQLANIGCGQQYERFAAPQTRVVERRGLFGKIFRRTETVREFNNDFLDIPQVGTYRTVCVRSCDGYFFPISFSTTENSFVNDQAVCEARCPGGAPELYVYKNPGETPEEMRSVSGKPYQSLETAFLYQKEFVEGCSCRAPQSQLIAISQSDEAGVPLDPQSTPAQIAQSGPIIPLPMPKQTAMIDPDTLAAERLHMTFKPYRPPEVRSDKGVVNTADGRSIRIVGPKFFGAQE